MRIAGSGPVRWSAITVRTRPEYSYRAEPCSGEPRTRRRPERWAERQGEPVAYVGRRRRPREPERSSGDGSPREPTSPSEVGAQPPQIREGVASDGGGKGRPSRAQRSPRAQPRVRHVWSRATTTSHRRMGGHFRRHREGAELVARAGTWPPGEQGGAKPPDTRAAGAQPVPQGTKKGRPRIGRVARAQVVHRLQFWFPFRYRATRSGKRCKKPELQR
jgi:hypothetical protein